MMISATIRPSITRQRAKMRKVRRFEDSAFLSSSVMILLSSIYRLLSNEGSRRFSGRVRCP